MGVYGEFEPSRAMPKHLNVEVERYNEVEIDHARQEQ